MPRIRSIKPEMWESEKVGRLAPVARLTFIGLISLADDEGRGRGDAEHLWNRLHGYYGGLDAPSTLSRLRRDGAVTPRIRSLKVWWTCVLRSLAQAGLVVFYRVDGCSYYWLQGFCEHQKVDKPSKSKLPAPPESANARESLANGRRRIRDQGSRRGGEGKGPPPSRGRAEDRGSPGDETPPPFDEPPLEPPEDGPESTGSDRQEPPPTPKAVAEAYLATNPGEMALSKAVGHVERAAARGVSLETIAAAARAAPVGRKLWDILDPLGKPGSTPYRPSASKAKCQHEKTRVLRIKGDEVLIECENPDCNYLGTGNRWSGWVPKSGQTAGSA